MRRPPFRHQLALVLVLTGAMLAGGCGGESTSVNTGERGSAEVSDSSESSESNESARAPDDSADADESEDSGSDSDREHVSPLGEFLGWDFGDDDAMQSEFAEMERRAEELTAECMRDQGFEYLPNQMDDLMIFDAEADGLEYGSDEWIDKYGFGISTTAHPQSAVGPNLVGYEDQDLGMPDDFEDPNQEYVDSLSEGAREVYYAALHGEGPQLDPSMSDEEAQAMLDEWEPTGCFNIAREEIFSGGGFGPGEDFYQAFGDQLDAMFERIDADPRIVQAQAKVGECVSERGLFFDGDWQELHSRFGDPAYALGRAMQDPFAAAGVNPDEMSQEEIDDFFDSMEPPRLSPEEQQTLATIQAEEIELAQAVRDCGGGPRDLDGLYEQVRVELELEFLEQNAEALEAFRADE